MKEQFRRTAMLFGEEAIEKLNRSRVAVFGLGGVGGYVVEALARAGVGSLDLIDKDVVSESNINRQIIATHDSVGQNKTDICEQRVRLINPECMVTTYFEFFLPETAEKFNFRLYDYIVDAIDTVTGKLAIIEKAKAEGVPVISCMGTGNKMNPMAFQAADLYETSVCPLAKVMRRECRRRGIEHLKVIYSKEEPLKPLPEEGQIKPVPGSNSFVPAAAGLLAASEVIKDLTGWTQNHP